MKDGNYQSNIAFRQLAFTGELVSNHDELMSNFFAQPDALAYGKVINFHFHGITPIFHIQLRLWCTILFYVHWSIWILIALTV